MTLRNLDLSLAGDGKLQVREIGDPLELWQATRRFFSERRPVKVGRRGFRYPETTNGDVRQLAQVWNRVHAKLWRSDLSRADQSRDRWKIASAKIQIATAGADPKATFGDNEAFWLDWTKWQAIYLSAVREMPSKWDMVADAALATAKDLPGDLAKAVASGAETAADATASAARAAGKIVAAPARGLFSGLFGGLGTPLLIGAAVVGGIVLVPRLWPRSSPANAGDAS
ncbi:MAG TPA: hypothetical protein VHE35_17015 [Kofleriaceae bacterium]|nr:hypothetical protein [Kofleriaceae bacterium]